MKTRNLDDEIIDWKASGSIQNNKSSLHVKAREYIIETYPTQQVLEEVPFNPRRGQTLYMDFFLPLLNLCIEVHGEQHYKFIAHYHGNLFSFLKHKQRDKDKKSWCELNNIKYIELPFNKVEEWKKLIKI